MSAKEDVVSFWDNLYKQEKTPWDQGGVPRRMQEFFQATDNSNKVLIPGCGSAYEAKFLAETGFDVTAIDISQEAVARAKQVVGKSKASILEADFFELSKVKFNLIYERAFLCSFSPKLRPKYVDKASQLLEKGGQICGFFFVESERESGPPYPIEAGNLETLMKDKFELQFSEVIEDGLEVFSGNERWQVWKKV